MKEKKFYCKACGQLVRPAVDGSCPRCYAPRVMLVPHRDRDDEENDLKK